MRLLPPALALVLLGWTGAACAHAHLVASTPAAGAKLRAAPTELALEFSEAAQLTALSIARVGEAPVKLAAPTAAATRIRIALPPLKPGEWTVRFRALSADGHLLPGTLTFTLLQ